MRHDSGNYDEIMRLTSSRRSDAASSYQFGRNEKFSADQTKFLEKVFVGFSEAVITQLAPLLQAKFQMELLTIVPRSYHSYLNSLPDPTPIMVFRLEPEVQGFIDIDFNLAFALFERLMGGKGQPPREEMRPYFTDLEKAVLQKPLSKILEAYGEAWKDGKTVKAQFGSLEFNPMAVHISSPSELMVIVPFQAEIASAGGLINVCLPFRYLRDCIPKASFDEFMLSRETTGPQTQQQMAPIFAKNLEGAKVPVAVTLGRAELLFQELMTIEVGDTIRLDTEIRQPPRVKVNNRTKFLGHPGIKDGKLACKVSRVLQEGDEDFDE